MGKTAALYHAVHYARRAGWVVLLVPSAYEYLHEGGLVRPSPFFKGYFDTVRRGCLSCACCGVAGV